MISFAKLEHLLKHRKNSDAIVAEKNKYHYLKQIISMDKQKAKITARTNTKRPITNT